MEILLFLLLNIYVNPTASVDINDNVTIENSDSGSGSYGSVANGINDNG